MMSPNILKFLGRLVILCAIIAQVQSRMPGIRKNNRRLIHKLMRNCEKKGYPVPSAQPDAADGSEQLQDKPVTVAFENALQNLSPLIDGKKPKMRPQEEGEEINCGDLSNMMKTMNKSSEGSACYMTAFMAPCSLEILTSQNGSMDPEEYDSLLQAAKAAVQNLPARAVKLPPAVGMKAMRNIAKRLKDVYVAMTDDQRALVAKWIKEVSRNDFNCTQMQKNKADGVKGCKVSLSWLNSETLETMGPFLSYLSAADVDSSPKQMLCDFIRSPQFMSSINTRTTINPSLRRKFKQRFQECFSDEEIAKNIDKLGPLACFYEDFPDLPPDESEQLLSQLDSCDDPGVTKERKKLLDSVMSQSDWSDAEKLNKSATLVPPDKLSRLSRSDLKKVIKKVGFEGHWTKAQKSALVQQLLGEDSCKTASGEELVELGPIIDSVPRCVLKRLNSSGIIHDSGKLEKISRRMTKGQLKATLLRLREGEESDGLMSKLPDRLLQSVSLDELEKVKDLTMAAAGSQNWTRPQAAFIVKKTLELKKRLQYGKLNSLVQGVTCRMTNVATGSEMLLLDQDFEENPQWVSRKLARCAARRYFATLYEEKKVNFSSITNQELDDIPAGFLIFLPSWELKKLPDSACPVFLDKLEEANLDLLPRGASHGALLHRALSCYLQEKDVSSLTEEDVSRLGPLVCFLNPSQHLSQMEPDVLKHSLQLMTHCERIPPRNIPALMTLVGQTLGNPSDWSEDTMERFGSFLYWDEAAVTSLPNKLWVKDVLQFLRRKSRKQTEAIRRKIFDVVTGSSNDRRRRAVDPGDTRSVPTVDLVQELDAANIYWSAEQLHLMSQETFVETVETFGNIVGYLDQQLEELCDKSIQAFGRPEQMNSSVISQLGCISRCFSDADLTRMDFSVDDLEPLARCGWSHSEMTSVWTAISGQDVLQTLQEMGAAEISSLSHFICGLKPEQIRLLSVDAFKDAVNSINDVRCLPDVGQKLKDVALQAFGPPRSWTAARVAELGNIIAWLDEDEMSSLDPQVFSFIHEGTIPLVPPENFARLTEEQLEELGPDNAAVVTPQQRAEMSRKQVEALERAGGEAEDSREESGASTMWTNWTSFMKPLLSVFAAVLLLL